MKTLPNPVVFVWDKGNSEKNQHKHGISNQEAEEVFSDSKKILYRDVFHSVVEERYIILGKTRRKN